MKWFLDVAFIALGASYKYLLGVMVLVGVLVGILFATGVLGGGDDPSGPRPTAVPSATPTPVPTPTLAPSPTPVPTRAATPTSAPVVLPTATTIPTPTAVFLQEISVPIFLDGAANVGSLEFVLVYEPTVLEVTRVETGALASNALLDFSTPTPGRVWTGMIDTGGITGEGPAAVIIFAVIGNADSSTSLILENVVAYDAAASLDIIAQASAGSFVVKGASLTAPTLGFLP